LLQKYFKIASTASLGALRVLKFLPSFAGLFGWQVTAVLLLALQATKRGHNLTSGGRGECSTVLSPVASAKVG
jgi:hypothetical protein